MQQLNSNSYRSVALKIDFKISQNKLGKDELHIFDIGDLSAGMSGFNENQVTANMLNQIAKQDHIAQNSSVKPVSSVFGELPSDFMLNDTLHIPIIARTREPENSWNNFQDIKQPCFVTSHARRIHSVITHLNNNDTNIEKPALGLIGTEMHKILWYALTEKHLEDPQKNTVVYWINDSQTLTPDLSQLDLSNGVFIKIVDRSIGGADNVFYAKDTQEIQIILKRLQEEFHKSKEQFKKHIFVIEPAYQTIKAHNDKKYNVTGRAFIVLKFNQDNRALDVEVAGAKWIFPKKPLTGGINMSEQMLANVDNSSFMIDLENSELKLLQQQIITKYGEVFKVSIEKNDLITYLQQNSIIEEFKKIIRPNAAYKIMLEWKPNNKAEIASQIINSLLITHYLPKNQHHINAVLQNNQSFFYTQPANNIELTINNICYFSLLECVSKYLSQHAGPFRAHPTISILLNANNKTAISDKIEILIKQYLGIKSKSYDQNNFNRALRQAAFTSDLLTLKLLIGTKRADINASSPNTRQTALDFALDSKEDSVNKELCIRLLKINGAKSMKQENIPEITTQSFTC